MYMKFRTSLIAATLLAAACADDDAAAPAPAPRTIAVTIGCSPEIRSASAGTRTEIDTDDGQTIRWNTDDRIALWASNTEDGTAAFEAQPFRMYHYDETFDRARFTGDIPEMAAGSYSYYAVSPLPDSFEGTRATFAIPALQQFGNGAAQGKYARLPYDVMIAAPIADAAELTEGDNSDRIALRFSHKVHLLKLTVRGNAMGEPVTEMDLIFPQPVVGRLTLDVADPEAPAELTESGNTLTLRFAEPVEPGTTVFAAIAPTDLTGEPVRIVSYGETGYSEERSFTPKKAFAAGHTTPLAYDIPAMGAPYTHLVVTLPEDRGRLTLGEEVRTATLTAPEGALFDNGSNVRDIVFDAEGRATIHFKPSWEDNLSGKEIVATLDSDHARLNMRRSIVMPAIEANAANPVALEVPYLFEEDFSGAGSFSGPGTTSNSEPGKELSGSNLPGWYAGSRAEGIANTCVNIRHYNNLGGPYASRIDSSPMSAIKPGTSVTLLVRFNADWKKNRTNTMKLIVGRASEHNLNSPIENAASIAMSNNGSASSTNIPTLHEIPVAGFTAAHGIAWKTDGTNNGMFAYEDLYIDNVRVSIVAE